MSNTLDLKDLELDYDAEKAKDQVETPTPRVHNDTPGLEPRTEDNTGERKEPEEGQEGEGGKPEARDEDNISQTSSHSISDVTRRKMCSRTERSLTRTSLWRTRGWSPSLCEGFSLKASALGPPAADFSIPVSLTR